MPIESEYEPAVYNCDGSQTEFSFSFKIFETSELKVYKRDTTVEDPNVGQTLLTEGVDEDYTVSAPNNDYSEGGKVTTNEAYGSDYKIVITRDVAETQTGKFIENDNFPSAMNQNIVDKLCILVQERKAIEARLLKLAITSLYTNLTLPDPVADKILSWKADLSGLKNIDVKTPSGSYSLTAFAETLFDDEDAVAFLATLGLTVSTFIKTLLDDADAATVRTTIGLRATDYYSIPMVGYTEDADVNMKGESVGFAGDGQGYIGLHLDHGITITKMSSYVESANWNGSSLLLRLYRIAYNANGAGVIMAANTHTADGSIVYSPVGSGLIDNSAYKYYLYVSMSSFGGTTVDLDSVILEFTRP